MADKGKSGIKFVSALDVSEDAFPAGNKWMQNNHWI